jgi:hypothetical protein
VFDEVYILFHFNIILNTTGCPLLKVGFLLVLSSSCSCKFVPFSVIQKEKLSLDNWMLISCLALDCPGILTIISTAAGRVKFPPNLCCLRSNSVRCKKGFLPVFCALLPVLSLNFVLRVLAEPYQAVRWQRKLNSFIAYLQISKL